MTDDNSSHDPIIITLLKRNGQSFKILLSSDDKDLAAHRWSVLIGPKGQVYAHRKVEGQKVYLSSVILSRKLGHPLKKGQRCYHLNGNTHDKTRANLSDCRPKKS